MASPCAVPTSSAEVVSEPPTVRIAVVVSPMLISPAPTTGDQTVGSAAEEYCSDAPKARKSRFLWTARRVGVSVAIPVVIATGVGAARLKWNALPTPVTQYRRFAPVAPEKLKATMST